MAVYSQAMRRVTKASLERSATYYLERYSATRAQLIKVLTRKVLRFAREKPVSAEAPEWIEEVATKLESLGYVDDARYAAGTVRRLGNRGRSLRTIAQTLKLKGVPQAQAKHALEAHDEEAAAWSYARRRKLGPYAPEVDAAERKARRQKHLAALVRRGFSFGLAKRIVDSTSPP